MASSQRHRFHAVVVLALVALLAIDGAHALAKAARNNKTKRATSSTPTTAKGFAKPPPPPPAAAACASSSSSPSAPPPASALERWLKAEGASAPYVEIARINGIRGVRAKRAFAPGDELLRIPRRLIVDDRRAAEACAVSGVWAAGDDEQPPPPAYARLALVLLHELRTGDASAHAEYLRALPTRDDFDVEGGPLCLWSAAEVGRLECPKLVADHEAREELFRSGILAPARLAAEWERLGLAGPPPAEAELRWAVAAVTSRAYGARDADSAPVSMLIPLVDMANHAHPPNTAKGLDEDGEAFIVLAAKPIAKGDEVFLSYGALPNMVLLPQFGFVVRKSGCDVALVHCPEVAGAAAAAADGGEDLARALVPERGGGFSEWQPAGAGLLEALEALDGLGALPAELGAAAAEPGARAAYAHLLRRTLDAYSTRISEDAAILADQSSVPARARLAAEFKYEQKAMLNSELASLAGRRLDRGDDALPGL